MTTKGVQISSLDVGQGMCTFVEIYDTTNKLTRVLLFDLGSTKNSKVAGPATTRYLATRIKERDPPNGYLDAIFVSHKDSDHVSLIPGLLEAVPDARIGAVYYGGRRSWYKSVLTDLEKRCANKTDVKGFPIGQTNYADGEFKTFLWRADDVTVYLLVVNTPYGSEKPGSPESSISSEPDGDQANSKSLVCIVSYKGDGFCISGDATFPTMAYVNAILGDEGKLYHTRMMLLPHHGSRKTTFGLSSTSAEISDKSRQVVDTFAKKASARTLIASADTKHSHPSLETISIFHSYTDPFSAWWSDPKLGKGLHYLSAFWDLDNVKNAPSSGQYVSYQTSWNVYSNLYANPGKIWYLEYPVLFGGAGALPVPSPLPALSFGMNWLYWIPKENKEITLSGVDSGRVSVMLSRRIDELPTRTVREAASSGIRHAPPRAPLPWRLSSAPSFHLSSLPLFSLPRLKAIG